MERTERSRKFVGYEYKEIVADSEKASLYLDVYECFGWEADENLGSVHNAHHVPGKISIRLKRDRKIVNKMELTRLQRNFEACVKEIEMLEREKSSMAAVSSLSVGILGTAFMAGSVFAVTADPPMILLCILLAVPAFIGWILPYFIYKKIVKQQTERVIPLIEEKYDEIYELCEKGNKLLY